MLCVAFAATLTDAALLQRKRSYFTGGFLSVDHVTTVTQALGFVVGSLLGDLAVAGVVACAALWVASRLRLGARAAFALTVVSGLAPIAAIDFVSYQIQSFLGDAFDPRLMFDLAGRRPSEFIAVGSAHAFQWLVLFGSGLLVIAAITWVLLRRRPSNASRCGPIVPWKTATVLSLGLTIVSSLTLAAMRSNSDVLDEGLRRKPSGRILGTLVEVLSDVDRDGYGLLGRISDPDIFNAAIHPYALDIPGNGVDEDGVAGDLPSDVPAYVEPSGPGPAWLHRPPVLLVALESFRADAYAAVVDGHPVTPFLSALAARGASSAHAYSHNGYTVQSRYHIFSGSVAAIREGTLVDDFNAAGYETAYFSGQDETFGGPDTDVGFLRASVHYDARQDRDKRYSTFSTAGSLAVPYNVLEQRVGEFLQRRSADRPLFLYVNFHDTHFPYHHETIRPLLATPVLPQSDIVPARSADVRAMYLNTAANVDAAIGRVVGAVRDAVGEPPAVIVLSDHGESLFDEGFLGHGYALNGAQTRIPLVVSGLPLRLTEPFGQSDLRDAIRAALANPAAADAPNIEPDPEKRVFQYLGAIDRPAEIALTGLSTQVAYDFRSSRVRVGDDRWRRPGELSAPEAREFTHLVQLWESMMIARSRARR